MSAEGMSAVRDQPAFITRRLIPHNGRGNELRTYIYRCVDRFQWVIVARVEIVLELKTRGLQRP